MNTKQVIVVRKDLNMRKGKIAAQVSHGSMSFLTKGARIVDRGGMFHIIERMIPNENTEEIKHWLTNSFRKICVYVNSEEELDAIHQKALDNGLISHMIIDNGATEFNGILTKTVIAIGPHEDSKFEGITSIMNHVKRLFLVRHGTSEGNVNKQVYFEKLDCDVELTGKGKADAICAADRIHELMSLYENEDLDYSLFHSTYKRATQTANILFDRLHDSGDHVIKRVHPTPLCREREWGSLRDIIESNLKSEEHFNFYYTPLGGESFADVYQRAAIFHQQVLASGRDNNIVVAHGEFNKVYLMHLLGWDTEEFETYANPHNGEVWMVEDGVLSKQTPLRVSSYARRIAKRIAESTIKTELQS